MGIAFEMQGRLISILGMHAYAVMFIFGIERITAFFRHSISANLFFSPLILALFFSRHLYFVPFPYEMQKKNFQSKKV